MEEGFTVLYVGWLLIKVCLVVWSCLFCRATESSNPLPYSNLL
jgi:hypothetical protein